MKITEIILFPFQLLFIMIKEILKIISRFILKNDIKEEQKRNAEICSVLTEKLNHLKKENDFFLNQNIKFNRFREIINNNKNDFFELTTTKNNELVIISYSKLNTFNEIKLFGENGNYKFGDSIMKFTKIGDTIHIQDFESFIKEKGYGRVLMTFSVKKAFEENFSNITGNLAAVDSDSFKWLIPFYESFGFECIQYEESNNSIMGKIELTLKNRYNSKK
jgi:hypothetical protein